MLLDLLCPAVMFVALLFVFWFALRFRRMERDDATLTPDEKLAMREKHRQQTNAWRRKNKNDDTRTPSQ